MALTHQQFMEVISLINQTSSAQRQDIVQNLMLHRDSIQNLLGIVPSEMQKILDGAKLSTKENTFIEVVKGIMAYRETNGTSSQNKKKYQAMGLVDDQQNAYEALMRQSTILDIIKKQEEVMKLRHGNKKDAEEYLSVEVLTPIFSQGLGNVVSQLRAAGMLNPILISAVNKCIEEILRIGKALISEANEEIGTYLTEYELSEEKWERTMEDLKQAQIILLEMEIKEGKEGEGL